MISWNKTNDEWFDKSVIEWKCWERPISTAAHSKVIQRQFFMRCAIRQIIFAYLHTWTGRATLPLAEITRIWCKNNSDLPSETVARIRKCRFINATIRICTEGKRGLHLSLEETVAWHEIDEINLFLLGVSLPFESGELKGSGRRGVSSPTQGPCVDLDVMATDQHAHSCVPFLVSTIDVLTWLVMRAKSNSVVVLIGWLV